MTPPPRSLFAKLLQSENAKVFAGTTLGLVICAIPVFGKGIISGEGKKGHDLFSQEKPEIVEARGDKWAKEARLRREGEHQNQN